MVYHQSCIRSAIECKNARPENPPRTPTFNKEAGEAEVSATMSDNLPIPALVSVGVAARLLGLAHGPVFTAHIDDHPELFPNSPSPRLFALADLNSHPRRQGRPVTVRDYLEAECSLASLRAKWRK